MILHLPAFYELIQTKLNTVSEVAQKRYYETNPGCALCNFKTDDAREIYHKLANNLPVDVENITEEVQSDLKNFEECEAINLKGVLSGEFKVADFTEEELTNYLLLTREELKKTFMTSEELIKQLNGKEEVSL